MSALLQMHFCPCVVSMASQSPVIRKKQEKKINRKCPSGHTVSSKQSALKKQRERSLAVVQLCATTMSGFTITIYYSCAE